MMMVLKLTKGRSISIRVGLGQSNFLRYTQVSVGNQVKMRRRQMV